MRCIGVDPGAKFTGVAILESDGAFSDHREFALPLDAWHFIEVEAVKEHDPDDGVVVALEDFLGGGVLNRWKLTTIKIVGYIYWRCLEAGVSVLLVPNQVRLANVANVPNTITGKDEIAAAAHALTARERWQRT